MNDYDAVSVLKGLIETCKDGQEGFKTAADNIKNGELQATFRELANQRGGFAEELNDLITNYGGNKKEDGTLAGAFHRGWINIKSVVTGGDDHAVLEECERGEDAAKEAYSSALTNPMPPEVATVVRRQYEAILDAHRKIKSLRDSTGDKASSATSNS